MGLVDAQRLAQYINRNLLRAPDRHLESNTPLISSGLLDSFSLIRVLTFIEDEFGVTIPDQFVTEEAMNSVALIVQLATKHGRRTSR
jgi:acyl carrier protein